MGLFGHPYWDDLPPVWQRFAKVDPTNRHLPLPERRAAFRRLFAEFERRARAELALVHEEGPGERTFLWDPVDSICRDLEISRVAMSRMMWEFCGMRAHEFTDKLKARLLPRQLKERLQVRFQHLRAMMTDIALGEVGSSQDLLSAATFDRCVKKARMLLRGERSGSAALSFAIDLGYANFSRLKRACALAHGISLTHLEDCLIDDMVQKFLAGLHAESMGEARPAAPPDEPAIQHPYLPENDAHVVFASSKQLIDRWLQRVQRAEEKPKPAPAEQVA